ncbi:hypothetical protein CVT24_011690 [Panaeolus cyanescens]|uniref:Structural maintenance of chromosomes protein 4 n=1 Tax=Panaeolus cyanescens TaxID=181874 RepID=A0A409YH52_9AGAR|nr:hypothetical protein CVT24_011690 [Panaeolus cyanescens]
MVEVERLQEERQIKLNRVRLVEKEKIALEERKKEAEDFLRLKNDYIRAVSVQYQWIIWKALENDDKLNAKMEKLNHELTKETDRNKDDITLFEQLQQHYQQREEDYTNVQAAAAEANKELASNERAEIGLQERRKHAATRAKKLKKSLTDDKTALKNATNTIEDSSSKMKNEKAKLEQLEISLEDEEAELEKIRDSLKDKTQAFHDQIQVKQRELAPWTGQINDKQAEIDVARSERDALAKKAEDLRKQTKEAQETLRNLQGELEEKSEEQAKIKSDAQQISRDIQAAEQRVKAAQAAFQDWRGKATSARNKVDEARASQSENRSRNNVLDSLTRLRDAGQLEGFHGRLGSLGTIPEKYDVAISTACGGPLNNMVVDKVSQAQQCIEYLRKNNVGRASFMVLEKLSADGMQKINAPLPRLFDLVKPKDPAFAPAFYKAMRDTLVAETVDQANHVAFGQADRRRWRVVSLDGAVIETSGAMSGGGGQPQRGAMSSKLAANAVSPQLLQGYERDNEAAAQQLQKATNDLRIAESELEGLKTRGPELDLAYQKIGMEINNMKQRIAEAERPCISHNDKPNKAELARMATLDREIESNEEDLAKIQSKAQKIEQDIKALEKKILDVGGARLLTQKSKVDGIRLHISLANDEIAKAEVAKAKAQKDITKLENNIASNEAAFEEANTDLETLEEQVNTLVDYITDLKTKVEDAQAAVDHSKEDLENIKSELDEQEAKISKFKKKEMAIRQEIQDTEKEWKENNLAIEHYQQLHDDLKLEEIDDEEDEEEDEEATADKPAEEGEPPVKKEGGDKPPKAEKAAKPEGLPMFSADELRKYRKEELLASSAYLEEKIKNAKPDLTVLKEYKKREAEYMERVNVLASVTAERDAQKAKYDGLRKQRLDEFMTGFNLISMKLKEMYQMITLGGNAELELVDSLDPFSEGIIFSVMPPKKSWKNISNLSGGEKTLSSLALVFALHVFKPTPLYFMDEIDAALDFRNVSIVANYIKDRTKNAQFIIISLRNDMFELSHRLIGIYKTSNQTRSLSIDNHSLQGSVVMGPKPPQRQQQQQPQNGSTKGPPLSSMNGNASFATPSAMS